jgi:electron transfer flavoprotein alpha subunit
MKQGEIWVYGDLRTARFWNNSLKVLAKAQPLAQSANAPVAMVLVGAARNDWQEDENIDLSACIDLDAAAQEAASAGAGTVYCLEHPQLRVPRTDVHAGALSAFIRQQNPWLILIPLSDFGRETGAICAQHCKAGLIAECVELAFEGGRVVGRCPAWGGRVLADITLADGWSMAFVTVQPHGADIQTDNTHRGEIQKIPLGRVEIPKGLALKKRFMKPVEARRLEDAEIVIVGGAGLGNLHGFGRVRELAASLGGEVGATRLPVLNHWVDENRLIGQTGKTVRPRLLISVGTSGAVQYTAGITEADTIVAINRDPNAPIFMLADIGIVADAATLLPLLTKRAEQMAMRRLTDAVCTISEDRSSPRGGFGALVRQLREARDWSVEDLAQHTGQTPDFIAQVEADQLSPSVSFILRMAQAMQVDPGTFLKKEEQAAIHDRHLQAYYRRTQEYSYTNLTPNSENSHLHAFMVAIEPRQAHKPVAYKHEGEEFIYLMEGDLEFTLASKVYQLKPGESIHFNSNVPHKLRSLSSEPTRCLVVLYTI